MLPRLPRQVMRVKRDAMTADARAGIEGHETEWFRRRRTDDFPCIDAQSIANLRHFIGHADIDRAEGVLPKLAGFGNAGGGYSMHFVNDLSVQKRRGLSRIFRNSTDDLWNVMRLKLRIAGVDPLGRKRKQKILIEFRSAILEHRL